MRSNIEYISFGLVGVTLVVLSLSVQWASMDIGGYGLTEYVTHDVRLPEWWFAIGIPFCIGVSVIMIAVWGIRSRANYKRSLLVFGGSIAVGSVTLFFSPIVGMLTVFGGLVCLVSLIVRDRKPKRRPAGLP